jgi:uncharacterized protein (TIGR02594 family)
MEPREQIWLEIMKYYGLCEVPGEIDNPTIVGWFAELGFPQIKDDETSWCSLLMNIACKHLNFPYTGKLTARSWNRIGKQTIHPGLGDFAIFYRGSRTSWQGHIGLFAGYNEDKSKIWTLGGNQQNKIWLVGYPVASPDFGLLEYRTLTEAHIQNYRNAA